MIVDMVSVLLIMMLEGIKAKNGLTLCGLTEATRGYDVEKLKK
jgi:hypothetical protein